MVRKIAVISSIAAIMVAASSGYGAAETDSSKDVLGELYAMNLEDILNIEVFSASKRLEKIPEAPSAIYVFTAEDIQRTGVRNLMELVKYIPGFYVYPRTDQTFVIANRGIRSSSNDKILYMIDGMPINTSTQGGAVNLHLFPGLEKVKRVEVINGPGSTMWGSDAVMGIINIITKDADDIDGHVASVNVATEDNHRQVDLLSGKKFDWGEYMLSATYAENDGFSHEENGFKSYVNDYESIPWNEDRANFNHLYPSYEIYGKIKYNDFSLKTYIGERNRYSFWQTTQSTFYHDMQDVKSIVSTKEFHLELSHEAKLTNDMTLETKLSGRHIDYVRGKPVEVGWNHGSDFICDPSDPNDVCREPIHDRKETFPEKGAGLEFQLNWDINEQNRFVAGTRARIVEAGPGEFHRFNINTDQPPANPNIKAREVLFEKTTDKTIGAYIEDTFAATDNLTLIGGVRIDYNDPRETRSVIMPRGSAIYKFTDALSAKYMYNTGYIRPQMSKSYALALTKHGKADESQKIQSHDVALSYMTEDTQVSVDFFHMTVYDLITYIANQAGFYNDGDITSQGVELLFKQGFFDGKLVFDLNYGYAEAEKEDDFGNKSDYLQGLPKHVYAAGLTYQFTYQIALNANVTGWRDLEMDNARVTSWYAQPTHPDSYSGDYVVNFNLRFDDLLDDRLDVSLYVLNALDREARLQAYDDWHTWWTYERERSFGIKASWTF